MTTLEIILAIFKLLAGLGAFLIGFKLLTDNIEKIASKGLKKLFSKTSNRFLGIGIGALITALIQSSAVTTVMVVGFVNSGIMDLFTATAVIMGANIGTTITAQIVALDSFKVSDYAMLLAAIGMFMNMIAKKDKVKSTGLALAGFGLVFLSLNIMSDAMSEIKDLPFFQNTLASINNPLLLLLIGIVFTFMLQSSAAVTTIIIQMVGAGIAIGTKDSNSVLFVILGTNIGTCLTSIISSIGANSNAKRASLIHLMFNVFGAVIFSVLFICYKDFMKDTFANWFDSPKTQIAMFHTFFNVICVALFLPFINVFVFLANKIIKDDAKNPDLETKLDERLLTIPSIAITQTFAETDHLLHMSMRALDMAIDGFLNLDLEKENDIREQIKVADKLQENLLNYLIKISARNISKEDEEKLSKIQNAINDIYREIEIADNLIKYTRTYIENDLDFSPGIFEQLNEMKKMLDKQSLNVSKVILYNDLTMIEEVEELEEAIDNMRSDLMKAHMDRLEKGLCKIQNSSVFINLTSNLERAGDHLNYIAHSLSNKPINSVFDQELTNEN